MANPIINSAAFNKASYAPGEQMLVTVDYTDPDSQPITATITLSDSAGNSSAPKSITANITDAVTEGVTSVPARPWAKVSDNGKIAVFSATA